MNSAVLVFCQGTQELFFTTGFRLLKLSLALIAFVNGSRPPCRAGGQNVSCQRLWTRVWTEFVEGHPKKKTNSDSQPPLHLLTHKNTMKKEILAFTTTTASKFLKNRRNLYHAPKKNNLSSNYWFKPKKESIPLISTKWREREQHDISCRDLKITKKHSFSSNRKKIVCRHIQCKILKQKNINPLKNLSQHKIFITKKSPIPPWLTTQTHRYSFRDHQNSVHQKTPFQFQF